MSSFVVDGSELLARTGTGAIYWGSFPSVPYPGRIRDGTFDFGARNALRICLCDFVHGVGQWRWGNRPRHRCERPADDGPQRDAGPTPGWRLQITGADVASSRLLKFAFGRPLSSFLTSGWCLAWVALGESEVSDIRVVAHVAASMSFGRRIRL